MEFLYLGNLIPNKGVLVLLDACRLLADKDKSFRCHIVGAGSKELSVEDCRSLVESLNLVDLVEVHGPLYGEEKEKMWKQCDVFVFPTFYHNECFPLVILEAMQHSLPVISTPVGAIPDMVIDGETGMLVSVNDAQALAVAMSKIMEKTHEAYDLGTNARLQFTENYTVEQFENTLISILQ